MISALRHPVSPASTSRTFGSRASLPMLVSLHELAHLADLNPDKAVWAATDLLVRIAHNPLLLEWHFLPALEPAASADAPYVAYRHEAAPGDTSLQVFVWPTDAATEIHDHSCWGAFTCVAGSLIEERYERLDDGLRPNSAHLKRRWQRVWRRDTGVSTLLPYEGGIHRVRNANHTPAMSVHLYGPIGDVDGRDYDPSRDYVCDRLF